MARRDVSVAVNPLEEILLDLPRRGTLIKGRSYRQIWRFELNGKPYYLKFYPRRRMKSTARGNPAMREFQRLQLLQKAGIPSPRASSSLIGYTLDGVKGDAVLIEGIEPSVQLDQYLSERELRAETVPDRKALAEQVIEIVEKLGRAGLGHNDLHLGNFLICDGKVYLLDAYAIRRGGLKRSDVAYLGASCRRFATYSELSRGWLVLGDGGPMPKRSRDAERYWRKFVESSTGENDWFGRLQIKGWHGHFFKRSKFARRWSEASGLRARREDWQAAWPKLWEQIESGQLEVIKHSLSGDVLAGEIELAGRRLAVVIKRPYKRYWYRHINEIGRGRARRAWLKAWRVIVRNIPTAWPLLVMEKSTLGYVSDSVIVMERVPGTTLAAMDLDALPTAEREMLLHRTGSILRRIDETGLAHFDAKASNWIVLRDNLTGARPVLVDVDGIRSRRWIALGIDRLLRSMRQHPKYTPADSLALCRGYAPFSKMNKSQKKTGI
jgi:tRNA A-37 threonylcarbamoyl transferase component Bud32